MTVAYCERAGMLNWRFWVFCINLHHVSGDFQGKGIATLDREIDGFETGKFPAYPWTCLYYRFWHSTETLRISGCGDADVVPTHFRLMIHSLQNRI